ncbi:MAG: DUF1292 domain-containing protein [Candidatus Cloacimonadales bacterium]|jgi:hypothetical protein|nr:DUF1292 domain-containing protein [Candidatus Cloacimonadota bacterium]MDD2650017.1 DUF1292 domain-containing protein [Candidatus Cloacimonadota bacterium]MDX9977208.1 DUF1292 domain-containing protein [Candidatus Cloacimonadales bacterium]
MADINDKNNVETNEEDITIDLELEDGTILECLVLDTMEYEGEDYIALLPEGQNEYLVYGYKEHEDGIEIINIDDDELFSKVIDEFEAQFEEYDDEDEDFDDDEDDDFDEDDKE